MIQIIVLAGGMGLRLESLTTEQPKIMVEVNGRPFIHYQLDWLESQNVTEVLFAIGFKGEIVQEWLKHNASRFKCRISTFSDGPSRLGTLGSLEQLARHNLLHESFLVTYGDTIPRISLQSVHQEMTSLNCELFMTGIKKNLVGDRPNMLVNNGFLLEYSKDLDIASEFTHIEYGVIGVNCRVLQKKAKSREPRDLSVLINEVLGDGPIPILESKIPYLEMGSVEGLVNMQREMAKNKLED